MFKLMTDNFLKSFSSLRSNNSRNITFQSNTLPSNECSNGVPKDKYAYYSGKGVNPWEVLYSIWNSYQNTIGAQFTLNQATNKAPNTNRNTNTIGPSNIFIIRHGEKNPTLPNYSINNNGIYRACQLMNFINNLAQEGTPISYIVTCNPCPYNTLDPSIRPIQTISMVSFMLNIPVFIFGGSQEFTEIVSQLFSNDPTNPFNGLNILICWEHSSIQALCLNILNEAGKLGRLSINPTNGNPKLYGDAFFKSQNECPDGNYECLVKKSVYYYDPLTSPDYIGPNSKYYPYWNNYNFNSVYHFKSELYTNIFNSFKIYKQPILTCDSNCDLHIGLYQPLNSDTCGSSYLYSTENYCGIPTQSSYPII